MMRVAIGLLVGVAIVITMAYTVGFEQAWSALVGVSWTLLAFSLVAEVLTLLLKAHRWTITLQAASGSLPAATLPASMISFAGNLILPARLGELLRNEIVSRRNGLPRSLVLTTIILTQLFDLVMFGLMLVAISLLVALESVVGGMTPVVLGALVTACGVVLFVIQRCPRQIERAVVAAAAWLPGRFGQAARYYASQFVGGLRLLGDHRAGALAVLLTFLIRAFEVLAMVLGLAAFGIAPTWLMALTLVVINNFAFILPLTPGNLGTRQFVSVAVLALFGVAESQSFAFSVGTQAAATLVVLSLGGVAVARLGLDVLRLTRTAPTTPARPTEENTDHAECPLPRSQGAVPDTPGGDSAGVADGVRELQLCPGANRPGV